MNWYMLPHKRYLFCIASLWPIMWPNGQVLLCSQPFKINKDEEPWGTRFLKIWIEIRVKRNSQGYSKGCFQWEAGDHAGGLWPLSPQVWHPLEIIGTGSFRQDMAGTQPAHWVICAQGRDHGSASYMFFVNFAVIPLCFLTKLFVSLFVCFFSISLS